MDTGSAVNEAAEQGFKLLDKVTEFRFFLALLSVAVALDVALAWTVDRNILSMDWGTLSAGSASRLALAAVAYVFWMAALSPLSVQPKPPAVRPPRCVSGQTITTLRPISLA